MIKYSLLKATNTIKKVNLDNFDVSEMFCDCNNYYEVLKTVCEGSAQKLFKELNNIKCTFTSHFDDYDVEAYAIEVFEEDEYGEFLSGSDFYIAEVVEPR